MCLLTFGINILKLPNSVSSGDKQNLKQLSIDPKVLLWGYPHKARQIDRSAHLESHRQSKVWRVFCQVWGFVVLGADFPVNNQLNGVLLQRQTR